MRQFLLAALSIVLVGNMAFAQGAKSKNTVNRSKANEPMAQQNKVETKEVMKKDGTPDKRYKANAAKGNEAAPAGPTKKDGTPDKRYKSNKDAAKTTDKK